MQLHHVNKTFIKNTIKNIKNSPSFYYKKPIKHEYKYDKSSYADGFWHPEHLFTNSNRNRNNAYWKPLQIGFHTGGPNYKGEWGTPGVINGVMEGYEYNKNPKLNLMNSLIMNKYDSESIDDFNKKKQKRETYINKESWPSIPPSKLGPQLYKKVLNKVSGSEYIPNSLDPNLLYPKSRGVRRSSKPGFGPGPGHRYQYNFYGMGKGFTKSKIFPPWQYYPQYRHHERNISETLAEGGRSDRRIATWTRGFNMTPLRSKPHYENTNDRFY